jgi:hypothetical protein
MSLASGGHRSVDDTSDTDGAASTASASKNCTVSTDPHFSHPPLGSETPVYESQSQHAAHHKRPTNLAEIKYHIYLTVTRII